MHCYHDGLRLTTLLDQGLPLVVTTTDAHHLRHEVYGDGEDDGAVLLGRDVVEGLKVS